MKHIKILFVIIYYGFYSEQSYKFFCLHFEKMTSMQWLEFKASSEYAMLSNFFRWPQIEKGMRVARVLCVTITVISFTIMYAIKNG